MSVAVVTGATGLLGANVAAALREAGHEVRCTRRSTSRVDHLDALDLSWVLADLTDPAALAAACEGVDVVFHCAAQVDIRPRATEAMERANVDGTVHVCAAARAAGARLVHCSTVSAVGLATGAADADETTELNFAAHGLHDGYVDTKHRAEEVVRDAVSDGLDAVIVNPGFMFGPYDRKPSSGTMILAVKAGRTLAWTPGVNSFVDVRDVADGMLRAWQRGEAGRRYILAGDNLCYRDIFQRIADVVGGTAPRHRAPWPLLWSLGKLGDVAERITGREQEMNSTKARWAFCEGFRFSSRRAEEELGYTRRPVEEGIGAAMAWFVDHGMA